MVNEEGDRDERENAGDDDDDGDAEYIAIDKGERFGKVVVDDRHPVGITMVEDELGREVEMEGVIGRRRRGVKRRRGADCDVVRSN